MKKIEDFMDMKSCTGICSYLGFKGASYLHLPGPGLDPEDVGSKLFHDVQLYTNIPMHYLSKPRIFM